MPARIVTGFATLLAAIALLSGPAVTSAQTAPVPGVLPDGEMPLPPSAEAFRTHFDSLFQEHTYLAGATTEALVNNRREEYLTAQAALNTNSVEIARVVGAVYGPAAESDFLLGWKRHIQDYQAYAQGAAAGSDAQRQAARTDLDAYVTEARAFLQSLTPNAPADALGTALANHVHGTLDVIDAQAAQDVTRAYTLGRQGAMMTATDLADPLAVAIVQQFPDRFPGDVNGSGATPRRQTTLLVQADTLLGGAALSNAVMGRQPAVDAIAGVLEQNTTDLVNQVGSSTDTATAGQFGTLWRSKQAALMDYANAVPANNVAGRQAALQRLDSFRKSLDQVFGVSGSASIGDRFISQTTYVTSALDALGAHDLGTAKAFFGGASQQSEEIGARLARATTPTPAVAGL